MSAPDDTPQLRAQVLAACRDLMEAGLLKRTAGNVSVRVADGLLVTPADVPFQEMTADSLCKMSVISPPAHNAVPRPTSGWALHQSVMRTRPDVMAVIHAQPPFATAVAAQRRGLDAVHYSIAAFGGVTVPVVDYAHFSSTALARDVARAVASRHGCLMANHGALTVGRSLEEAAHRMETLEELARIDTYTRMTGTPVLLSAEEVAEVMASLAGSRR